MRKCPIVKKGGFTLIELLLTITVMAILASIVTISGIGIYNSIRDSNNKTALDTYYANSIAAMTRINGGNVSYEGNEPSAYTFQQLLKTTTGVMPQACYILSDEQTASISDNGDGYYVCVRYADPYGVDDSDKKWIVDTVFLLRDEYLYKRARTSAEITKTKFTRSE